MKGANTAAEAATATFFHASEIFFMYDAHPKSFQPRHIRQQYFLQSSVKRTSFTDLYESAADVTSL